MGNFHFFFIARARCQGYGGADALREEATPGPVFGVTRSLRGHF